MLYIFLYIIYTTINAIKEKLSRQSTKCHGGWIVVLDGMVRIDLLKEESLEGSEDCAVWINIWGKNISRRGTASSKALTRNLIGRFQEQQGGQCSLNRENQGEIIRDEVREVPKPRSCAALPAIVRILSFTLSIIGNNGRVWSGEIIQSLWLVYLE